MTVLHEMQVAHAVQVDRRHRRAAPLRQRHLLPSRPDPVRGRPEAAVEVAAGLGRSDDGVQAHHPQAQVSLAAPAQGADDLVQDQHAVGVGATAAQPVRQGRHDLVPSGPQELVLDVRARESRG